MNFHFVRCILFEDDVEVDIGDGPMATFHEFDKGFDTGRTHFNAIDREHDCMLRYASLSGIPRPISRCAVNVESFAHQRSGEHMDPMSSALGQRLIVQIISHDEFSTLLAGFKPACRIQWVVEGTQQGTTGFYWF